MHPQDDLQTLRERTVAGEDLSQLSLEEALLLIRELSSQQMELETRNHELVKANQAFFRLQEQHEHLKQQYHDLYHIARVGYYTLDEHGTILDVNPCALEQLGAAKDDVLHRLLQEYLADQDVAAFTDILERTVATTTPQTIEIRFKRRDGELFPAKLVSSAFSADENSTMVCLITAYDLTALARARQELLDHEGEMALFNRVSQVFSSAQDLDHILVVLMEEVRRLFGVTACSIWLIDPDTQDVFCRQAIGPHRDTVIGWRLKLGQGIVGWVARNGESLIVPDTWGDERHFNGVDRLTGQPLRSILTVPMCVQRKIIGVVQVLDNEPNRFTATDQTLQELLATMASMAIENARLYEQGRQDAKTRNILFHELNRRIEVMLTTTIRLFTTVRRYTELKKYSTARTLITAMLNRMKGLRSMYALLAEFEWNPVPASELANRIIRATLEALLATQRVTVEISPSAVRISPAQADSLALILNELTTNTVRHALSGRNTIHITVHIVRIGDNLHVEFRDDGPGWPDDVTRFDHHQVGVYLLQKIVRKDLKGKIELYNDNGAVTALQFKALKTS